MYRFIFSACLISLLALCSTDANPIERRAVDAATFANLQLFEQYAAASYCPSNNDDDNGGKKLTCPPAYPGESTNCPLVEASEVTTVYEFENSLLTDVTGFVASDASRSLVILSFRGSASVRNFFTNAQFPTIPTPDICTSCSVSQGFYRSWVEARPGVLAAVTRATDANPTYTLVVAGHSLGGAIAAIAAAEIRNSGRNVELYTYGAPRIGGAQVSDYITNQNKGGNYRVTHFDDPVPRLPPIVLGFRHISPEYYIRTGNDVPVTDQDINTYNGNINFAGNSGNINPDLTDFDAHGWYFNNVSHCNPSGDFEFRRV